MIMLSVETKYFVEQYEYHNNQCYRRVYDKIMEEEIIFEQFYYLPSFDFALEGVNDGSSV